MQGVEPFRADEQITAFVVVRLWWDAEGTPPLRARVRSVPEARDPVVRTVVVAGRGAVLDLLGRLLDEFEQRAGGRADGD